MGFGLKEAKDFVESAPKILKKNLLKKDADELKLKLEKIGVVINLK